MLTPALQASLMKNEFFMNPTPEEADEITRILEAKNHFEVLELDADDDLDKHEDDLRGSYMRKCLVLNPNTCDHPRLDEAFAKVAEAYDVLCDPVQRKNHKIEHFGGETSVPNEFGSLLDSIFNDIPFNVNRAPVPRATRQVVIRRPRARADELDLSDMMSLMFGNHLQRGRAAHRTDRERENREEMERRRRADREERLERERRARVERRQREQREARERQRRTDDDVEFMQAVFRSLNGTPPPPRLAIAQPRREPLTLFRFFEDDEPTVAATPVQRATPQVSVRGPGGIRFALGSNSTRNVNSEREVPVLQATPAVRRPAQRSYEVEVSRLKEMGFTDEAKARRALSRANGDVEEAVEMLLG